MSNVLCSAQCGARVTRALRNHAGKSGLPPLATATAATGLRNFLAAALAFLILGTGFI